jgi:lysophospholipase
MQAAEDTLVIPEAQDEFAKLVDSCTVIRYEGSKHEIFNATDDIIIEYYRNVFRFFEGI